MINPPFLPFSRPAISEEELDAVTAVLRSGWLTTGPETQRFETEVCAAVGGAHAVAVCSATAGMHITLMALGIGPGDEVITPSLTWVSTVNLITLLGAVPVFVDVDRDTLMVEADAIRQAITSKTKAIIPVHYAGAPVNLDPIYTVAIECGIAVIEDAAHAIGTLYKGRFVGQQGTAIFSFHAIKNLTCGEGGMVVTDDPELADRLRRLKFHGLGSDTFDRTMQGRSPQAEVVEPGLKYNLSDLHAALGRVQLRRLNELNQRRHELVVQYREALESVALLPLASPAWSHTHTHHLMIVRVDAAACGMDRATFMSALKEKGIGSGIHFRAVHQQAYYKRAFTAGFLPHTEWNSERVCSLPLFPDMTSEELIRVKEAIEAILL